MTDETDDPDTEKVVDLFPEVDRPPLQVSHTFSSDKCKHRNCTLDEVIRLCVCSECGARLEPFDWLVEHCGADWTRYWATHVRVRKDIERLANEREDLKREVKNLKSQTKRWQQNARNAEAEAGEPGDPAQVALKSESKLTV